MRLQAGVSTRIRQLQCNWLALLLRSLAKAIQTIHLRSGPRKNPQALNRQRNCLHRVPICPYLCLLRNHPAQPKAHRVPRNQSLRVNRWMGRLQRQKTNRHRNPTLPRRKHPRALWVQLLQVQHRQRNRQTSLAPMQPRRVRTPLSLLLLKPQRPRSAMPTAL